MVRRLQKYRQLHQPDDLELHGCTQAVTFTHRAEDCQALQKKWIYYDDRLIRVVGSYDRLSYFDILESYRKFDRHFV